MEYIHGTVLRVRKPKEYVWGGDYAGIAERKVFSLRHCCNTCFLTSAGYEDKEALFKEVNAVAIRKNKTIRVNNEQDIEKFNKSNLGVKLSHEAALERNFTREIRPESLCKDIAVQPTIDNRRIANQQGAFIICTLNNEGADVSRSTAGLVNESSIIRDNRLKNGDNDTIVHLLIRPDDKARLQDDLRLLGIDTSVVYPEIEATSEFVKCNV